MNKLLFLIILLEVTTISCKSSVYSPSLVDEIEEYLAVYKPGFEIMPEDVPRMELYNQVTAFEDSLTKGVDTGHPHIFGYDITGDGLTDYLVEIFSLTYRDSTHWNYTTTAVLLFGSEQGLSDSEYEFGGSESLESGDFYHSNMDYNVFFLKAGKYYLENNTLDSLKLDNPALVIYQKGYEGDPDGVGILEWREDKFRGYILINGEFDSRNQ